MAIGDLTAVQIDVPDVLYRMDRVAAMVEGASLMADAEGCTYSPSAVLDLVISEIVFLKNIIDIASAASHKQQKGSAS